MEKIMPKAFFRFLDAYTTWVGRLVRSGGKKTPGMFLRKWGWQIALNLLLIAAVFIGAIFLKDHVRRWWPSIPGGSEGIKGMVWLTAMVLSLPMLIAIVRKWQAFAMMVSEMSVTRAAAGERTLALRGIVSSVVFVAGCAGLFLFMLVLSTTVLPSRNLLIVLVIVLVAIAFLLRRTFIQVHTKAQFALQETLNVAPLPHHDATAPVLPSLLRDAALVTITVPETSPAVGKLLAHLKLRTVSGASIVGIDRNGESIVNPGVSEEIHAGDSILLLGSESQIEKARAILMQS